MVRSLVMRIMVWGLIWYVDDDAECGDYLLVANFGYCVEVVFKDFGEVREYNYRRSFCFYYVAG